MSEKEMVKRSIFKQRVYAKRYTIKRENQYRFNGNNVETIYVGKKEDTEQIKEEEIFTCKLEIPMLEIGEKFYIEELNQLVKVYDRVRTSKENVVYYIESKYVSGEETKISFEECNKIINNFDEYKKFKERVDKHNNSWLGKLFKI